MFAAHHAIRSFAVLLCLLLCACAGGSGASASSQAMAQPQASLTETYWKLTELMGQPVGGLEREPHIVLREGEGSYHGFGGCNRIAGRYEHSAPGRIRFSQGAATMMACIDGMEVEAQLLQALGNADSYTLHGQQLQLNRARMAPLARFEAVYLY